MAETAETESAQVDLRGAKIDGGALARVAWEHARTLGGLLAKGGVALWGWAKSPTGRQVLGLLFVAGCFVFLSQRVKRSQLRHGAFTIPRAQVALAWPEYISTQPRAALRGAAGATLSPFDAASLPGLVEDLARQPWLADIEHAAWRFPAHLELRLNLRVPYAWVELSRERVLVDREGHLLPTSAYRAERLAAAELPSLRGVPDRTLPLPGQLWDSKHVSYALAFLDLLEQSGHPDYKRGARVDVSRVGVAGADAELFFVPRGLPPIAYGRSPADPRWRVSDEKLIKDLELLFRLAEADPAGFADVEQIRLGPLQPAVVPAGS